MVDQLVDCGEVEFHLFRLEAVLLELSGDEVAPGDLAFFKRGVAGEPDDLHAVPQRSRNRF
ncbi:hypothetical protein SDC9_154503 [bioreactor metagenome]|uniref:Uncharacterized protein n=1 Tax=bioreactor metagenome TaxID=1076179 RepID=A0A645EZ73_9ZZZZ